MTPRKPSRAAAMPGPEEAVSERGFALLFIFVLAAAVAIMLYTQMPRVAFESERDKEQLLINRGEQYKRAIQLFYAENRRFPARIEDLENTNNHRYLRRRFKDPYTGKDEWRLIHTNGMFLTDSLVQKPPANPANFTGNQNQTLTTSAPGAQTPNGPQAAPNPNDPNAPPPVNAAVLARPSDRPIVPAGGVFPTPAAQPQQPVNTAYIDPASYPPITLFPNGYNAPSQQPGQPAQPGGQFQPGAQPGFQPGVQPGAQPGFPQQLPFQQNPLNPSQTGQFQPGQFQPGVQQTTPFQQGQSQPGQFQPAVQQTVPFQQGQFQPGAQPQPLPFNQFPNPADPNSNPNAQPGTQQFPGQQNATPGLNQNFANQFPQPAPNPILPTTAPYNQNNFPNPAQQPQFPIPPATTNNPSNLGGTSAPPSQALNVINQMLTTARPVPPGVGPGGPAGAGANGQPTVGGGIAGVASTFKGPTIKSYAEKTKFEEWEFVFQLQQQGVPGQGANPLQNQQNQNGQNPINPNATGAPGLSPNQPGNPGGINPTQIVNPATQPTTNPGGLPPLP